jgi:cell division protein FtsI (penicillin-binding protein 3)
VTDYVHMNRQWHIAGGEPPPTLRLEGAIKQAADVCRQRLVILTVVFCAAFLLIAGRLVEIMAIETDGQGLLALTEAVVPLGRSDIADRNGVLLATDLPTASLYADPHDVIDAREAAVMLQTVLTDLDYDDLVDRLSSDRGFIWIKRNLTPRQQADIHNLGIPGIGFMPEERRVYPQGALTAHVVGFTDIDRRGLAGVEQSFDHELVARAEGDEAALNLSIDIRFQQIVREELMATIDKFHAIGGAGIVLDVHTGEVLAMVSLPDFDSNRAGEAADEARFNRATLGVYEVGSIFKVFTAAMALDAGVVTMASGYDASEPIRISHFTIRDYKPKNRWLSLPEILVYSSNIGAAKMALDVGAERQQTFLRRIGLMTPSQLELPGEAQPMAPSPWREINTMTIGFGHGIAVTPIQVASAIAAMVNGGTLYPATILKWTSEQPPPGVQVIDPETSDAVRLLMHLVVRFGSGRKAQVPGYLIGGKTGTAEKLDANGGYDEDNLLSSFVAAFPIDDPRYVVLAMIDEPQGIEESYGYATGGWTAAPTVGQIIARIGPLAGIAPHDGALPVLREAGFDQDSELEAILASFSTH